MCTIFVVTWNTQFYNWIIKSTNLSMILKMCIFSPFQLIEQICNYFTAISKICTFFATDGKICSFFAVKIYDIFCFWLCKFAIISHKNSKNSCFSCNLFPKWLTFYIIDCINLKLFCTEIAKVTLYLFFVIYFENTRYSSQLIALVHDHFIAKLKFYWS